MFSISHIQTRTNPTTGVIGSLNMFVNNNPPVNMQKDGGIRQIAKKHTGKTCKEFFAVEQWQPWGEATEKRFR
jgi:hypothetical protein